MDKQLIFFADPMCSWCWGFAPVMAGLRKRFADQVPIKLVMGGLRANNEIPMDDGMRLEIGTHWKHVEETTGQPFDYDFFKREKFVYDTEPACRAVVTMRMAYPQKAADFLDKIHQAFYAEGRDTTDESILCDLAEEFGVDRDEFAARLGSEPAIAQTAADFTITRQSGVQGFPTLLAGSDEEGYMLVVNGYAKLEAIEKPLDDWLREKGT